MNYATIINKETEWGVSQRSAAIYCKEGKIKGTELLRRTWFVPKEAKKSIDLCKLKS